VLPVQPSLWLLATPFLPQSLQSFRFEGERGKGSSPFFKTCVLHALSLKDFVYKTLF
jgi:hypothetical protein